MEFTWKEIETEEEKELAYEIYRSNPQYFQTVSSKLPAREDVENDWRSLPAQVDRNRKHYSLYFLNGKPVAVVDVIEGFPDPDVYYIGLFMIAGTMQRQGVGRALFELLKRQAAGCGCRRMRLGVVEENTRAAAFWSCMGFEKARAVEDPGFGKVIWIMEQVFGQ